MPDQPRNLDVIQRWMQAVITHPMGVEAGADSDEATSEIDAGSLRLDQVIHPSSRLGVSDRIRVYADAYYGRLIECLANEFPILAHAVGEETFNEFAFEYLQQYPSQSYTLNVLGSRFADFLERTRPDRDADDLAENPNEQPPVDWPDFMIGLATFRTYINVIIVAIYRH